MPPKMFEDMRSCFQVVSNTTKKKSVNSSQIKVCFDLENKNERINKNEK